MKNEKASVQMYLHLVGQLILAASGAARTFRHTLVQNRDRSWVNFRFAATSKLLATGRRQFRRLKPEIADQRIAKALRESLRVSFGALLAQIAASNNAVLSKVSTLAMDSGASAVDCSKAGLGQVTTVFSQMLTGVKLVLRAAMLQEGYLSAEGQSAWDKEVEAYFECIDAAACVVHGLFLERLLLGKRDVIQLAHDARVLFQENTREAMSALDDGELVEAISFHFEQLLKKCIRVFQTFPPGAFEVDDLLDPETYWLTEQFEQALDELVTGVSVVFVQRLDPSIEVQQLYGHLCQG
jgi:hypothetical protein